MVKQTVLCIALMLPLLGCSNLVEAASTLDDKSLDACYGQAHEALRGYVRAYPFYTDAYETYGDAHVRAMVEIRTNARWGNISDDLFLNAVLPPVSLREKWVDWRPVLQPLAEEITKEAKTPLEGALLLNRHLWKRINVVYSTGRDFPNQDPLHSMRINKASCSGLSIILVDACRSVGIPARVVGCLWRKKPGNHSWVEVYSEGEWYTLGAFEDTPPNDVWFANDAAQADPNALEYSIYATRLVPLEKEPLLFYGWGVPAENVTARYLKVKEKTEGVTIHIAAERNGARVEVPLMVNGETLQTPGPLRDLNDYATVTVPAGETITFTLDGKTFTRPLKDGAIFVEQL